jgi:hypothetical protein
MEEKKINQKEKIEEPKEEKNVSLDPSVIDELFELWLVAKKIEQERRMR